MTASSFTSFPVLTTERLVLRSLEAGDDHIIFQHRNDAIVNTYLEDYRHATITDTRAFISRVQNEVAIGKTIFWVLTQKDQHKFIGAICLWNIVQEQHSAEIGYTLDPAFHKIGYMQEAMVAVLAYGFDVLQLQVIDAYTHQHNEGSIQLLLRNKFKQQAGLKKEAGSDRICFSLTQELYR